MTSVTSRVWRGCCCVCVERRSDEDDIRLVMITKHTRRHSELAGIIYSWSSPGPGHFSLDMGYLSYVC